MILTRAVREYQSSSLDIRNGVQVNFHILKEKTVLNHSLSFSSDNATWLYASMVSLEKHLSYSAMYLFYQLHLWWEREDKDIFLKEYQRECPDCKLDLNKAMQKLIDKEIVSPFQDKCIRLNPDYVWNCPEGVLSDHMAEITFRPWPKVKHSKE